MKLRAFHFATLLLTFLLLGGCSSVPISPPQTPSVFTPQGTHASSILQLTWVMLDLGSAIFVLVLGLLAAALLRGRRATSNTSPDSSGGDVGRNWAIWGGIALPLVVISIVFGYSIYTLAVINNSSEQPAVKIQVVGRQWWWQVQYPDQNLITANEIHIPVRVPVQIQVESADVIHSLWVPELNGKMDAIPPHINYLTLEADQPGEYRGECAEFCGLQHAHMGLMVVAESSDDFNTWLKAQQQAAAAPTNAPAQAGLQVFLTAGCAFCHIVRGVDDSNINRDGATMGPDLTHLESRLTIAGASLTQDRGNLAGWIIDPQHVKPGSLMPAQPLNAQELQNLIAYLETLK